MEQADLLQYLQTCRDLEIALYRLTGVPGKNQEKITACLNQLEQLYAVDIIPPEYRNLAPMVMFCHYFENNLCKRLEGSDGAFQLFEDATLKEVSAKLKEIKEKLK